MPAYGNMPTPYSIAPGDPAATIVSPADGTGTLGTAKYSERVAIQDVPGGYLRPIRVKLAYASAPSSVEYDIFVSEVDSDPTGSPSDWANVKASTNTAGDMVNIIREGTGGISFNFLCVKEVTSPGVKTTITVRQ